MFKRITADLITVCSEDFNVKTAIRKSMKTFAYVGRMQYIYILDKFNN
jgi:hypothetical protein